MHTMSLFLSLSIWLFIPFVAVVASNKPSAPAFDLRVTKYGLDYANDVASNILNKQIRALRIPDVERTFEGSGRLRLKNIRLVSFSEPKYTYALNPPSTFTWKLENASVHVEGDWWGKKRVLVLVEGKGSVSAKASDVRVAVSAKFGRRNDEQQAGLPAVIGAKCVSNIGKLQLDVKGGIIASVMSLFKNQISAYLKPMIEKELCVRARDFLVKDVNARLATFPVKTAIHRDFVLDYGLIPDPKVADDYVELSLKGRITPNMNNPSVPSPYTPEPLVKMPRGNYMFYAWASDTIVNDLLFFAHAFNMTRFQITKDTPGAGSFLKLRCNASSTCVGSAVPGASDVFPASVDTAEVLLTTSTAPPLVRVNNDGTASLIVDGLVLDLYAHVPRAENGSSSETTKKSIARCSIDLRTDLRIAVQNMRIVGSVNISQFNMRILESELDYFTVMMIEAALPNSATPLLEKFINDRFAEGFPIPITRGVALRAAGIRLLPHTVQVESDVEYVG